MYLQVTDKRVSRNHATLELDAEGNLVLTPVSTCCSIKKCINTSCIEIYCVFFSHFHEEFTIQLIKIQSLQFPSNLLNYRLS